MLSIQTKKTNIVKFKDINNHIILAIETDKGMKNCVFDTGSPYTFFFDDINEYTIGESHFKTVQSSPLYSLVSANKPHIDTMVGLSVDGFIGTDYLRGKCVIVDFCHKEISFNDTDTIMNGGVPITTVMGMPIFNISINGITINAAFDSGAMYSFVNSSFIDNMHLISEGNTFEDYNPMLGKFLASLYKGDIKIGNVEIKQKSIACSSTYDKAMSMVGVDAFIGIESLKESTFCLSYISNRFILL